MKIELDLLQCPQCLSSMGHRDDSSIRCNNNHIYAITDGILDLRPPFGPGDHRKEEENEFADGSELAEMAKRTPWRWISHFLTVHRFDKELVPCFGSGRFLELGGGSCYASAIVKSTYPEAIVYASDVAVNTLRNLAMPVTSLFPHQPDFYIAIAAEDLPFRDNTIDYIFGELFLHHSKAPSRIISEARRVLRTGGRLIFLEPSVPPHFTWLFRDTSNVREAELHINEDLLCFSRWQQIIQEAELPANALKINTNGEYQKNPWFVLAGRFLSRLPQALVKHVFPVGAVIDYRKP